MYGERRAGGRGGCACGCSFLPPPLPPSPCTFLVSVARRATSKLRDFCSLVLVFLVFRFSIPESRFLTKMTEANLDLRLQKPTRMCYGYLLDYLHARPKEEQSSQDFRNPNPFSRTVEFQSQRHLEKASILHTMPILGIPNTQIPDSKIHTADPPFYSSLPFPVPPLPF